MVLRREDLKISIFLFLLVFFSNNAVDYENLERDSFLKEAIEEKYIKMTFGKKNKCFFENLFSTKRGLFFFWVVLLYVCGN
jgi:hypothetical protein